MGRTLLCGLFFAVLAIGFTSRPSAGATEEAANGEPQWRQAAPGYVWEFPRDLHAHPDYKTEWWYITGHLQTQDEDAASLGFQLTFFRIGIQPTPAGTSGSNWSTSNLVMAHAALTDSASGKHLFSEVIWRTNSLLGGFGAPGDSVLAWCQAPPGTADRWTLNHVDGSYHLQVRDDEQQLAFDLICEPTRQPVFHGEGGFSPKSADGRTGSLYFSQPRMQVSGTALQNGQMKPVRGQSWLDREIFTSTLGEGQKGWDWLSLQLGDGRELMIYRLLAADGTADFALGTLVERGGNSTSLPSDQWILTPDDHWTSPETGARYPVSWRLQVPSANLDLVLEAVMPDQENVSPRTGIHYWEGAVRALDRQSGQPAGRGFVEMTGYGEGSRPPV